MEEIREKFLEKYKEDEKIDFEKHFKYALISCLNDINAELNRGNFSFLEAISDNLSNIKEILESLHQLFKINFC